MAVLQIIKADWYVGGVNSSQISDLQSRLNWLMLAEHRRKIKIVYSKGLWAFRSVRCRELGEFINGSLELFDDPPIRASPLENLDEFVEIPHLVFAASLESSPNLRSDLFVLRQNCSSVVKLVRT
jgi:hypothetical protein